jgi:hypothetical protein
MDLAVTVSPPKMQSTRNLPFFPFLVSAMYWSSARRKIERSSLSFQIRMEGTI